MEIKIRTIETLHDFNKMHDLDLKVWGTDPVPVHQTLTAGKNGGIILGAFAGDNLIGFLYSFPGYKNGQVYLCSHMMGIDPNYRNLGIGFTLKQKQAEEALHLGYKQIRWTYDPLQSRNGYLNIAKLGAVCSEYIENCYGDMEDGLNRNMPSDRFNVEWLIDSTYLQQRRELFANIVPTSEAMALSWKERQNGFPEAVIRADSYKSDFLFVPVPTEFQKIKESDSELALDWRMKTRAVFQTLFSQGWAVVNVIRKPNESIQYYMLRQRSELPL